MNSITEKNSFLMLADFQPKMLEGVGSIELTKDQILAATKAMVECASIMGIPILIVSINEQLNGQTFNELASKATVVMERRRPVFNALDDPAVVEVINRYHDEGRTNCIIGGLWTSICMSFTAQSLVGHGWKVFGLYDCCGDVTQVAHKYAIEAMTKEGVIPSTWSAITFALLNSWDNIRAKQIKEVFVKNLHTP